MGFEPWATVKLTLNYVLVRSTTWSICTASSPDTPPLPSGKSERRSIDDPRYWKRKRIFLLRKRKRGGGARQGRVFGKGISITTMDPTPSPRTRHTLFGRRRYITCACAYFATARQEEIIWIIPFPQRYVCLLYSYLYVEYNTIWIQLLYITLYNRRSASSSTLVQLNCSIYKGRMIGVGGPKMELVFFSKL